MSDSTAEDLMSNFTVRLWGVRGSIACPGADYVRYGGNTSCLEIRCGENLLIFDGGTGIRELGEELAGQGPMDADMYFTHTHIDHIQGVPFFKPIFDSANRLTLSSGHLSGGHTIREVLDKLMAAPIFPVPIDVFEDLDVGLPDMDGREVCRLMRRNSGSSSTMRIFLPDCIFVVLAARADALIAPLAATDRTALGLPAPGWAAI